MSILRPGQKVFTMPGSDWGVRVTQSAAALAYSDKVLSYGPLVYFPQWEPAGLVSEELVNTWNGAYSPGITLGQPGIGDGNTSAWFDGLNNFNDIWTAAFQAAFDGGEGTAMVWARINSDAQWADANARRCIILQVDVANRISFGKWNVIRQFSFQYSAGGIVSWVNVAGMNQLTWMPVAITWSASTPPTGEMRAYLNGAQVGATQTGLGVWVGNLHIDTTLIGALSQVPAQPWHGWLAHGAIWTSALSPAAILDLATI